MAPIPDRIDCAYLVVPKKAFDEKAIAWRLTDTSERRELALESA